MLCRAMYAGSETVEIPLPVLLSGNGRNLASGDGLRWRETEEEYVRALPRRAGARPMRAVAAVISLSTDMTAR